MTFPTVEISSRAAGQIKKGSLWIFANEFVTKMGSLKKGTWVNFETGGHFVGYGYVNPHSLIAGRLCSLSPVKDRAALLKKLITESFVRRKLWKMTSSYRGVFAESDFLPGLIVDVYVDGSSLVLVSQLTTAGMDEAKAEIVSILQGLTFEGREVRGLVVRGDSSARKLEGVAEFNEVVAGNPEILQKGRLLEDDIFFAADFVSGQKTGFFLDQRENRRALRGVSKNKKVLDLCCYSGGWGLSALKGGAEQVTFVDQSEEALTLVKLGMKHNGFDLDRARFVKADVFDFLEGEKSQYDVVVADPPAFVKSKKNLPQAIRAYSKLNALSLGKLSSNGILFSSSCSFHLSEQEFENILVESLQKKGLLGRVFHRGIQGEDHPWILNRSESRYLKCFGIQIVNPTSV